jgi:hypothetical protein
MNNIDKLPKGYVALRAKQRHDTAPRNKLGPKLSLKLNPIMFICSLALVLQALSSIFDNLAS